MDIKEQILTRFHNTDSGGAGGRNGMTHREKILLNIALDVFSDKNIHIGDNIHVASQSEDDVRINMERNIMRNRRDIIQDDPETTTKLDFSGQEMDHLPSNITDYKNLGELIASNCGLTSLPDNIGDLTELYAIIVPGNNITSFPDSIGNLINMEFINIHGSNLTYVPDSISNLDYNNGGNLMAINLGNNTHPKIKQKLERLLPGADIN